MTTRWKLIVGGGVAATAVSVAAVAFAGGDTTACGCAPDPGVLETSSSEPPPPVPPTSSDDRVITVSGSGTVRVEPDTALVNLGVQANAATGEEAMSQVNASSVALTEALVDAGIAEEDIQTSGLSLWPTTDDRGEINGYQASLNVNVTVRDIEAVGSTIDAAQEAAGAGFTIGGVSFTFADPESVLEQARIDAVADARSTAEQYAAAAGVTLGDVVSITEHSSPQPLFRADGAAMDMAAEAAGPSISPGQLDLDVEITVSFAISS
jgi:uncharacterized protein YggE